ncbi:hypothetical protein [Enterococcus pallens]|uniref:Uncharacterized protein n=1 Tax=Enterococcus pallens ATCC BAA-351 TaxID=1158607 RepID=R2Q4G0_9ENTE|nr:hypothetical protein [Enterococcus pallens]EOH90218.1 hypothetical protein UAU_04047 [Enterococcus pallens ATCC BAA-351]EOU15176.1 hypothetical protein I588_04108 [Enterococcus pallens ATCC BAA-351]
MNRILSYLLERQNKSNEVVEEKHILLGCTPNKISEFITYKDFHMNPRKAMEKLTSLLNKSRKKLIINGNLQEGTIARLIALAIKTKREFSVVVYDGYVSSDHPKLEKSEDLAVIVVEE